jgi:hypothetical protein
VDYCKCFDGSKCGSNPEKGNNNDNCKYKKQSKLNTDIRAMKNHAR